MTYVTAKRIREKELFTTAPVELIFTFHHHTTKKLTRKFKFLQLLVNYQRSHGFCSTKRLRVFLLPLDGMLVHCRSFPSNLLGFPNNLPVPIYTPGWREALYLRVKCLSQEHNTVPPARARTRTARSGDERTNGIRPPRLHLLRPTLYLYLFVRTLLCSKRNLQMLFFECQ